MLRNTNKAEFKNNITKHREQLATQVRVLVKFHQYFTTAGIVLDEVSLSARVQLGDYRHNLLEQHIPYTPTF